MNKDIGTFSHCSGCQNKMPECCTSFINIDDALMTINELKLIKQKTGLKDFYQEVTKRLYKIKNNEAGHCLFYIDNKCQIYDYRPIDCRLYPFGIINKDNNYYLVAYKRPCDNFEINQAFIDANISNAEFLIEGFKEFIEDYASDNFFNKLKSKEYIIVKQIK